MDHGTTYEILKSVGNAQVMTRISKGVQLGELWDRVILSDGIVGYAFQTYLKEVTEDITEPDEEIVPEIIPVTDIILDIETILIRKDTSFKINAIIIPDDATNKNVLWESSDINIVAVDENGNISGIDIGEAIITGTAEDGRIEKKVVANVIEQIEETAIIFSDELKLDGNLITGIDIKNNNVTNFKNKITTELDIEIYNPIGTLLNEQDRICTGSKLIFKENNITIAEYEILIYGDVNGDGRIDSIDLLVIERHILEIQKLNGIFLKSANTFKNGKNPTSVDLLVIQRHILGIKELEQI